MKLNELVPDERGVSPVVGVVILIAITVVLAAVVAGVVMGMGSNTGQAPSASFQFSNTTDGGTLAVTIEHASGDRLEQQNVYAMIGGTKVSDVFAGDSEITAGKTWEITDGGPEPFGQGDAIKLVWEDPSSDQSTVLAEYEVN